LWKIPTTTNDGNLSRFILNLILSMHNDMMKSIKLSHQVGFDDKHKEFNLVDIIKSVSLPTSAESNTDQKIVAYHFGCRNGRDANIVGVFFHQATLLMA